MQHKGRVKLTCKTVIIVKSDLLPLVVQLNRKTSHNCIPSTSMVQFVWFFNFGGNFKFIVLKTVGF